MESSSAIDRNGEATESHDASPGDSGLLEDAKSLWQELRGLAHEQLTLAVLEARLAGKSLVTMVAVGVVVAILLISAWLGIVCAVVLELIAMGVAASIAVLLAAAANLAIALVLVAVIRSQSRHLRFPATLRSLRPVSATMRASERP
jgi:hypothetical protein